MRTITENHLKRLIAQSKEAKTLGLTKIATALSEQIAVNSVRDNDAEYIYDFADLKDDVEATLWDAATRAQDFYGRTVDAREIKFLIEKHAEEFIESIRVQTGSIIGAYESGVPGEVGERTSIEVSEDDAE